MNLIDTLPEGWLTFHAVDQEPSIQFYFGADPRWLHELAVGERFGVVFSPNHFVHPDSPLHPWHYSVFRVDMVKFRTHGELERGHVQEMRRQLFVWEVHHFEELWLQIEIDEMTGARSMTKRSELV